MQITVDGQRVPEKKVTKTLYTTIDHIHNSQQCEV